MQQLTCKIDLSNSFYYLFFSFVLLELKPFVLKGKVLGKNSEKVPKSAKKCSKVPKIMKRFCPVRKRRNTVSRALIWNILPKNLIFRPFLFRPDR